jgi:hypothetical protein
MSDDDNDIEITDIRPGWLDDEFGEMSEIDRDTIEVMMTR